MNIKKPRSSVVFFLSGVVVVQCGTDRFLRQHGTVHFIIGKPVQRFCNRLVRQLHRFLRGNEEKPVQRRRLAAIWMTGEPPISFATVTSMPSSFGAETSST